MKIDELKAQDKPSLTVKEAADILGCSQEFIREAIHQGHLPIGTFIQRRNVRRFYISTHRLIAYLEGKEI